MLTKPLPSAAFLESRTKLLVVDLKEHQPPSVRLKEEETKREVNLEQCEKARNEDSSSSSRSRDNVRDVVAQVCSGTNLVDGIARATYKPLYPIPGSLVTCSAMADWR